MNYSVLIGMLLVLCIALFIIQLVKKDKSEEERQRSKDKEMVNLATMAAILYFIRKDD